MTQKFPETCVQTVLEYIECVKNDTTEWELLLGCAPWFRGQADARKPPLPGVFRQPVCIKEVAISERFAKLDPMFGDNTPPRGMYDEWLYLMQHVGIPTRLLDWSEGALIGLYFAIPYRIQGRNTA